MARSARGYRFLLPGGLVAAAVVLMLTSSAASASGLPPGFGPGRILSTNLTNSPGKIHDCKHGKTGPLRAYVCVKAIAKGGTGAPINLEAVEELATNYTPGALSGTHHVYLDGALNLSAGFLKLAVNCNATGSVTASAEIFWNLWIYDATLGSVVSKTNAGNLWSSGNLACPTSGGRVTLKSPALRTTFNTSTYSATGATAYPFSSTHTYVIEAFLGCQVNLAASGRGISYGVGWCNPAHSTNDTFQIAAVPIV